MALEVSDNAGPVVTIHQDGRVEVHKGGHDEAAKAFWEAVQVQGRTHRQIIEVLKDEVHQLTLQCATLMHDPFRDVIHGSIEEVRNEIPRAVRPGRAQVREVMEAINRLAIKRIQ